MSTTRSLLFFKYKGIDIPDGFSKSFFKPQFFVNGNLIITTAGEKFRFYLNRSFPVDAIKYVRIKSVNHVGTVLFACETTLHELKRTSTGSVGICFNTKPFITFSNGQEIFVPKFVVKNAWQLRKLHERLKNCTSQKNAKKLEQQIVHLTRYAKAKLHDWHYKVCHRICRRFNEISIPKELPSSKFAVDYDFAGFVHKLYSVSKKYKVKVITAPELSPVCCVCDTEYKQKLRPQDRFWTCANCGHANPRDLLKARQIENFD
jgi:transposase